MKKILIFFLNVLGVTLAVIFVCFMFLGGAVSLSDSFYKRHHGQGKKESIKFLRDSLQTKQNSK